MFYTVQINNFSNRYKTQQAQEANTQTVKNISMKKLATSS